jgi:hypothetical protein
VIIYRNARINHVLSQCRQADLESQLRAKARAAESAEQTAKEAAAAKAELTTENQTLLAQLQTKSEALELATLKTAEQAQAQEGQADEERQKLQQEIATLRAESGNKARQAQTESEKARHLAEQLEAAKKCTLSLRVAWALKLCFDGWLTKLGLLFLACSPLRCADPVGGADGEGLVARTAGGGPHR